MKFAKLALIFIALVAGIFAAIIIGNRINNKETQKWATTDKLDITKECTRIREAWGAESGWNDSLYKDQRTDIDQSMAMGLFTLSGYEKVLACLRENVANKTKEGYMRALHSDDFKDSNLQFQFKGIQALSKAENMDTDKRIIEVTKIHEFYTKVRNFINSKHIITPQFDSNTCDWRSFSSLQNGIIATAKSYLQNPLFKEIEHIPGFKTGLAETTILKNTNNMRSSFYTNLSSQIIDYFQTLEVTQDNFNLFNQIYKNFSIEEGYYGLDELATLRSEMQDKLAES